VDFDSKIRLGRFEPRATSTCSSEPIAKGRRHDRAYDAVASYRAQHGRPEGQHVLLLYTDGIDSVSRITFTDLLALLRSDNVILYALGYLENAYASERATGQIRLTSLARETGGDAFFPASVRDLTRAYARILDELGSRYTLGYVPTNTTRDGRYRKVQVKLTSADQRSAKIRTRPGYILTGR
jgi:Ca-activated chloride channel family protein